MGTIHQGRQRLRALRQILRLWRAGRRPPVRLVVGAAGVAPPGWTASEASYLNLLIERHWRRCFRPDSIDNLLAEHVWEHLPPDQGVQAARTCLRYLRPGGRLRIAVPDGRHPDPGYIEWVRPGGSGPGCDDHKVFYTLETLRPLLESAGFHVIPVEWFDAAGTFHQTAWNPAEGLVQRSFQFDARNRDGQPHYTSLIVDAIRPGDPDETRSPR